MSDEIRVIQENERITVGWYVDHSFDEPRSFRLWCDDPENVKYGKKSVIVEWEGQEYKYGSFWVTGPYFYATNDDSRDSFDLPSIGHDTVIRFVSKE